MPIYEYQCNGCCECFEELVFKSSDPPLMAKAIVRATTHHAEPEVVAEVSRGLGDAMRGLETAGMPEAELMQTRGW